MSRRHDAQRSLADLGAVSTLIVYDLLREYETLHMSLLEELKLSLYSTPEKMFEAVFASFAVSPSLTLFPASVRAQPSTIWV